MLNKLFLALLLLIGAHGSAQVIVENPANLPLPAEQMQLAYRVARDEVIQELFHGHHEPPPEIRITLRLGCSDATQVDYYETDDRRTLDSETETAVVCMRQWNLERFTYAVIRITERRLVPARRFLSLLQESLDRIRKVSTVSVMDLKKESTSQRRP